MRPIGIGCFAGLLVSSGCVIVNPSDVHMAASPSPIVIGHPRPSEGLTSYSGAVQRTVRQQAKVVKELQDRDWNDLVDETGDWMEDIHMLSTYAEQTNSPDRFRACCDALLTHAQALRSSAMRADANGCEQAIRRSDPYITALSRDFREAAASDAAPVKRDVRVP